MRLLCFLLILCAFQAAFAISDCSQHFEISKIIKKLSKEQIQDNRARNIFLRYEKSNEVNLINALFIVQHGNPLTLLKSSELNIELLEEFLVSVFKRISSKQGIQTIQKRRSLLINVLDSNQRWIQLISPSTRLEILKSITKIASKHSETYSFFLLSQWDTLAQDPLAHKYLDTLLDVFINKPTFVKNTALFRGFSDHTKKSIYARWGWREISGKKKPLSTSVSLLSKSQAMKITEPCGTCDNMQASFSRVLNLNSKPGHNEGVIIKLGKKPIGIIKKDGDSSFLATEDIYNKKGEIILISGGVYAPTRDLLKVIRGKRQVGLETLPPKLQRFYPLSFMLAPNREPMSPESFKRFIAKSRRVLAQWSP